MLVISSEKKRILDAAAYRQDMERLCAQMSRDCFAAGRASALAGIGQHATVQDLARDLVLKATDLGLEAASDITPFCLLALCWSDTFGQDGRMDWVRHILRQRQISGEARIDAVYAMLPPDIRLMVFGT